MSSPSMRRAARKQIDAPNRRWIFPVALVSTWIACGLIAGAATNANSRCAYFAKEMDARKAREYASFNFGWSLLWGPVALVASPIVTGFFYDGFSFRADAWQSPEDRKRACGA